MCVMVKCPTNIFYKFAQPIMLKWEQTIYTVCYSINNTNIKGNKKVLIA